MAKGRPSKWARMELNQPVWLNKAGIEIVVWDKYKIERRGTLIVSIGGLRWRPFMKHGHLHRYTWNDVSSGMSSRKRYSKPRTRKKARR